MDDFQNHLIVTVPPFHNQSVTSPISVGIFVMTNAGKSHDAQPFTYTPDSGTGTTELYANPIFKIPLPYYYMRKQMLLALAV